MSFPSCGQTRDALPTESRRVIRRLGAQGILGLAGLWAVVLSTDRSATQALEIPGGAPACSLHVERVAELGALEDSISLTQAANMDVAPLPAGQGWVVTDLLGDFTIAYDAYGGFRGIYLPRGDGPGEIRSPARASVDATDSLWVSSNRGRAVIRGPEGEPGRTLTAPDLLPVEGHTPTGLPYSVQAKPEMQEGRPVGAPHAVAKILNRSGELLFSVGPANELPAEEISPTSHNISMTFDLAAINDSTFYAPGSWNVDAWVALWTVDGAQGVVSRETVLEATEGLDESLLSPRRGRAVGMQLDSEGGLWTIGSVRRLTDEQEEQLGEDLAASMEGDLTPTLPNVGFHPQIRNRVHRGVLARVKPDGTVTDLELLDEHPRGFADERHFFTLHETDAGLLRVHIWRFERRCPGRP